jgi:hypothetical protein
MRALADDSRIRHFMRSVGAEADQDLAVYFTGGATAVLVGWRAATIDVDVLFLPESDQVLRALPRIKNDLSINVELASPLDFIPVPAGWQARSPSIARERSASFLHFDLYAQALAKAERGHEQDVADIAAMIARGLIDPARARTYFAEIEPELYRFPAIEPAAFRARVETLFP